NSRSVRSSVRTPSSLVSRPDENDFPLPRHTMQRRPGRACSSASSSHRRASISSLAALCFSGRLFERTATGPSYSSVTVGDPAPALIVSPFGNWGRWLPIAFLAGRSKKKQSATSVPVCLFSAALEGGGALLGEGLDGLQVVLGLGALDHALGLDVEA